MREENEKDLHLKMSRPTESEIRSAPDSFCTKIKHYFVSINFNCMCVEKTPCNIKLFLFEWSNGLGGNQQPFFFIRQYH